MATCNLIRDPGSWTCDEDVRLTRNFRATYRFVSDSTALGPDEALNRATTTSPEPIPSIGDFYNVGSDFNPHAVCRGRSARRGDKLTHWDIEIQWGPLEGDEEDDDFQENPLLRPVKYRLETETFTQLLEEDKDGNAIVNSAGKAFETPVEKESSRMVLVAEKNYGTLQEIINLNITYSQKVNETVYKGGQPRTFYCRQISSGELQTENGVEYYRAAFFFAWNRNTWDVKLVDQGYEELVGGELVKIKDANDEDIVEPRPLDGAGQKLAEGEDLEFLSFKIYDEADFNETGV